MSQSASPRSLSITYEAMSEKQKQALENIEVIGENDNMPAESVTNLIPLNAQTNQQLRKDSDGWKSSDKHYRKASYGAHASFRLRMLQEQRIQPSFITKIPSIRRQKLDELQHGDLNKSKFALYAVQNGHELFAEISSKHQ